LTRKGTGDSAPDRASRPVDHRNFVLQRHIRSPLLSLSITWPVHAGIRRRPLRTRASPLLSHRTCASLLLATHRRSPLANSSLATPPNGSGPRPSWLAS